MHEECKMCMQGRLGRLTTSFTEVHVKKNRNKDQSAITVSVLIELGYIVYHEMYGCLSYYTYACAKLCFFVHINVKRMLVINPLSTHSTVRKDSNSIL